MSPVLLRPPWISVDEIVTGERLQGLAEISLVPAHVAEYHRGVERQAREMLVFGEYSELSHDQIERLSSKRSLFVYTHELPGFLEQVWPRLEGEGYVLVTHNSDGEVGDRHLPWIERAGPKLAQWFAQNVTVRHPKLIPVPIGIANRMWGHGDLRALHRVISRRSGKPKARQLAAPFHPGTHPARADVRRVLAEAFPDLGQDQQRTRSYRRYLEELADHQFCACPRGNGIDTHRVWECLYLDVIPILQRSQHSEQWQERGLPVVLVDDWAEVTPAALGDQAALLSDGFSAQAREPLLMSYYAGMVTSAERSEGGLDSASRPA